MKLTTLNVVSPVASISLLIGSDVHHFVFTVWGSRLREEEKGCERVELEEEKGCEGTGGLGLEKGKGCEGKVKWGWRVQSRRREGGVQLGLT